jgi:hypothetical protein
MKKNSSQKKAGGVAQGVEVQAPVPQRKKKGTVETGGGKEEGKKLGTEKGQVLKKKQRGLGA